MTKRKRHGFPDVIYAAQHEQHHTRYITADKAPEALVQMGERVKLARYTFAGLVDAEGVVKLGGD
jgi:hypothetical protein